MARDFVTELLSKAEAPSDLRPAGEYFSRGPAEYYVVDFRKEWTRKPYISFWGPDHAGYFWSLPHAGRYTAEQLDARVGYTTRRRYVPSRRGYVGPWERFGVRCEVLEALTSEPDREGRWRLDAGLGPVVRNSAAMRQKLRALRYVPGTAPKIEARRAEMRSSSVEDESLVTEGQAP